MTQFSKTVSGVAPTGVTGVTVDLLRNNVNTSGATVRNQVDTFSAAVGTTGAWTGAFTTHAVARDADQVEVNYVGGSVTPNPVTVGGGSFLPLPLSQTTGLPTASDIFLSWSQLDTAFEIGFDGTTLVCNDAVCDHGFSASVNGGAAQITHTDTLTFSTPVTASATVMITLPLFGTSPQVSATFRAPQLDIQVPPQTGSYKIQPTSEQVTGQPSCTGYLVLNELTCADLVPGAYSVTDGSSTQSFNVPAPTIIGNATGQSYPELFVPNELGVTIPGLASGQTVAVTQTSTNGVTGATGTTGVTGTPTPVVNMTVHALTVTRSTPLGDLLGERANTTVGGACSAGLFFNDGGAGSQDLCGGTGAIPSPNNLAFDNPVGLLDETSFGSTAVLLPTVPFNSQSPQDGDTVQTPFTVIALPRYVDPLAQVAAANVPAPRVGQAPVIPSIPSGDAVSFSFAPVGTSTFTPLGNVNTPTGVLLPATVAPGAYDGRFTIADPGGNSMSYDIEFHVVGPSSAIPPAAPSCKSASKVTKVSFAKREFARIAKAKKHGKKKHHKKKHHKKKKSATAAVSCTSTPGTRVVLTVSKGTTVVATGTGTVSSTSTTIKFKGLKKGKYGLQEIYYYANGQSSEASHTLKVT